MKVLFLDVDGVLNNDMWFEWRQYCAVHKKPLKCREFNPELESVNTMLDERNVANLNRIIESTDCEIVLSSSWRPNSMDEIGEIDSALRREGLIKSIFGITPRTLSRIRGEEIELWLETASKHYDVESYVILDDDSDMLESQLKNFVKVDAVSGLTASDSSVAIDILNNVSRLSRNENN